MQSFSTLSRSTTPVCHRVGRQHPASATRAACLPRQFSRGENIKYRCTDNKRERGRRAAYSSIAPRAAAGMAMTTLAFEPVHALMGGGILGVATLAKLAINGKILGVSGSFKHGWGSTSNPESTHTYARFFFFEVPA